MASGGSARATVTVNRSRLIDDFIFEVPDSGGETTVEGHVGVAKQTETQFEIECLGESLFLKDSDANDLAGDSGQHLVLARGKDVNSSDLRFLVQLLRAKL